MADLVKVQMEDGRVVKMTRAKLVRTIIHTIGEKVVREAGIRITDSDAMRRLKCAAYSAAQTGKVD